MFRAELERLRFEIVSDTVAQLKGAIKGISEIYWQAKEIKHVIDTHGKELEQSRLAMVSHISPIGWDTVVLYGEYVPDRNLIR